MAEIDENQLAALRGLQGFAQKAMAIPKHRKTLLEMQKDLYPDVASELDAVSPVLDEVKSLRESFETYKKEREEESSKKSEEESKAQWEKKWRDGQAFLASKNYNKEGIEAVEKLMVERNVPDHEAGMALFEKLNPPPPPSLTGSSRFNWFDQNNEKHPDIQRLFNKDYDGFLAEAVDAARHDFRNGK